MAKASSDTTLLVKAMQVLIKNLELQDIRLVEASASQSVREGPLPAYTQMSVEIQVLVSNQEPLIKLRPKFRLETRYEEASGEPVILIAATYQMAFQAALREGFDMAVVQAYAERIGLFAVWPYWREHVNAMAARMGLPFFTVPLLKQELMISQPTTTSPSKIHKKQATVRRKK